MSETTYDEALSAYRRAARAKDFPAALAAVEASPPHPPREYEPDGTLMWDYHLRQEIESDARMVLGFAEHDIPDLPPVWTLEEAQQLKSALKPKSWDYEAALAAYWKARDWREALAAILSAPRREPPDVDADGKPVRVAGYRSIGNDLGTDREHPRWSPDDWELLRAAYDRTQRFGPTYTGRFYGDTPTTPSDEIVQQAMWWAVEAFTPRRFRDNPFAGRGRR